MKISPHFAALGGCLFHPYGRDAPVCINKIFDRSTIVFYSTVNKIFRCSRKLFFIQKNSLIGEFCLLQPNIVDTFNQFQVFIRYIQKIGLRRLGRSLAGQAMRGVCLCLLLIHGRSVV